MPYTMIDTGPKGIGGGLTEPMMDGQPTAWLPYVTVDNIKATLVKAEQAGARVLQPYTEIGAMGAIAVMMDPTGAAIGIWGPQGQASEEKSREKSEKRSLVAKLRLAFSRWRIAKNASLCFLCRLRPNGSSFGRPPTASRFYGARTCAASSSNLATEFAARARVSRL